MSTTFTPDSTQLKNRVERFQSVHADIVGQVRRVIVGQEEVLEQVLIALFVGGHCLITGLPGTAKTLLVRTLADTLGLKFKRIQFTPDLMPSDVVGTNVFDLASSTFSLKKGPVFTNIMLGDEHHATVSHKGDVVAIYHPDFSPVGQTGLRRKLRAVDRF